MPPAAHQTLFTHTHGFTKPQHISQSRLKHAVAILSVWTVVCFSPTQISLHTTTSVRVSLYDFHSFFDANCPDDFCPLTFLVAECMLRVLLQ